MKSLKLDHDQAQQVLSGKKTSTWRLFDDKDLSVNDDVRLIDKVQAEKPESWRTIGVARITRVIEKQLAAITVADITDNEAFATPAEMLDVYRSYFGNGVTMQTSVKIVYFDFRRTGDSDGPSVQVTALKIFTDGGSRGNPGPSASGFVLLDAETNKVLVDKGVYIGITTNNQAEYQALKLALEEAVRMRVEHVDVYMDSLLVVNQMKGKFRVSNRDLWPTHDAIIALGRQFEHITYNHVPRELNSLADTAVNRALDDELGVNSGKVLE